MAILSKAASLVTGNVLVADSSDTEQGREECCVETLLKPCYWELAGQHRVCYKTILLLLPLAVFELPAVGLPAVISEIGPVYWFQINLPETFFFSYDPSADEPPMDPPYCSASPTLGFEGHRSSALVNPISFHIHGVLCRLSVLSLAYSVIMPPCPCCSSFSPGIFSLFT